MCCRRVGRVACARYGRSARCFAAWASLLRTPCAWGPRPLCAQPVIAEPADACRRFGISMWDLVPAMGRGSCPAPVVLSEPEASAALASVWKHSHEWRAWAAGLAAPAPPEPPRMAAFLLAVAWARPPGHEASLCLLCGQYFWGGRGADAPCPRAVVALVSGRCDAALASRSTRGRRLAAARSMSKVVPKSQLLTHPVPINHDIDFQAGTSHCDPELLQEKIETTTYKRKLSHLLGGGKRVKPR